MNKRVALFAFIFLLSLTVVAAQYCPSPRVIDGERTRSLHLNEKETDVWIRFGSNPDALYRLRRAKGMEGVRAREQWDMLQRILGQVDNANELNKVEISRMLQEKQCHETKAIGVQSGTCIGQVIMSPNWLKKVAFTPEGVYAAALNVKTSDTGECSYFPQGVVPMPGKEMPKMVEEQGPYFDCNNVPQLALLSRTYSSSYKGRTTQFRVFSYKEWEIHCANIGGNYWELAKKTEYQQPVSIMPAAAAVVSGIGRIQTIKQLTEGKLTGVISRLDKKIPSRLNYVVQDEQIRLGQKVSFTQSATGLVISIKPAK
jgi:hypothetical protein